MKTAMFAGAGIVRFVALAAACCSCGRPPHGPPSGPTGGIELGTFELSRGVAAIQDPCYGAESAAFVLQEPVQPGQWRAWVTRSTFEGFGERVSSLVVAHSDRAVRADSATWQRLGVIGVDSGQAGIFAAEPLNDDKVVPADWKWKEPMVDPAKRWYSMVSAQSLGSAGAGVVPHGAVSSSGIGDGAYVVEAVEKDDAAIALRINFKRDD